MGARRLALVVATDQYEQPELHRLASPGADAEALAEVLGDPELGGFEVEVLRNPTSSALSERVERTLIGRHPSDLVLLHFSCHGLKDDAGELYLAATNTLPELLGSTAVEAAWVSRVMQRSRAQRVVLLLDCCYGGAFERGLIRRATSDIDVGDQFRQPQHDQGRGRVVITASTAMEYAFEDAELAGEAAPRPSIFTGALVDGLRTGDADRDQDGQVALGELYDFVYDRVRQRTSHQTPSKWEFGLRGDLYVARNPRRRARAATLAPELVDLIQHPLSSGRRAAVRELTQIAAGDDLTRAVAARASLAKLTTDDSRTVSTDATEALAETGVHLAAEIIHLGSAAPGGPPVVAEVRVLGGPLALTSAVTVEGPVHAWLEGATLRVKSALTGSGALNATVTLDGPAGIAELRVTGRADPPPPTADATPATREVTVAEIDETSSTARRNRLFLAIGTIILLATGIAIFIPAMNAQKKEGAKATTTSSTQGPSNYAILLTKISDPPPTDCSESKAQTPELAAAECGPATYKLWRNVTDLKNHLSPPAEKTGTCANPPPAGDGIEDSISAEGRAGRLKCYLIDKAYGGDQDLYVIEWGVYSNLVTGTYFSDDGNAKKYTQLYDEALADLRATI
jgi:caspase domain-containing protein